MITLTVDEAASGLSQWLEQALAGEAIRIRKGDALVELRPLGGCFEAATAGRLSPREALRCLQRDAQLTSDQAQSYLKEIAEERLAAEDHAP